MSPRPSPPLRGSARRRRWPSWSGGPASWAHPEGVDRNERTDALGASLPQSGQCQPDLVRPRPQAPLVRKGDGRRPDTRGLADLTNAGAPAGAGIPAGPRRLWGRKGQVPDGGASRVGIRTRRRGEQTARRPAMDLRPVVLVCAHPARQERPAPFAVPRRNADATHVNAMDQGVPGDRFPGLAACCGRAHGSSLHAPLPYESGRDRLASLFPLRG